MTLYGIRAGHRDEEHMQRLLTADVLASRCTATHGSRDGGSGYLTAGKLGSDGTEPQR